MKNTLPTRRAFLLLGLLTTLAGCTSPEANSPVAKGGAGAKSAATSGPVALRLAFFPNVTHAAALVGTGDGSFAKALAGTATIEERAFTAGPSEIEALFANEVDIGYIGPGPALNGFLKSGGKALKIIAGAASGGAALVARADVPISSIADLGGKRVAVPQTGGTQDISLRHFIKVNGLTTKDKGGEGAKAVDVVQYAPADTLTQFQAKSIDAAWVPEPYVARLEKEAGAKVVVDERTLWPSSKFSTAVVIVRTDFLTQHPEIVAKFLAAHAATVAQIQKDPAAAAKIIGERIKVLNKGKGIPDAILLASLKRTEITADPLKESVLTFSDWARDLGYQRQDRAALADLFADVPVAKQSAVGGVSPTIKGG